jgi:adenosylmethionine-8-amino-7-oxononanoate aminotransferase
LTQAAAAAHKLVIMSNRAEQSWEGLRRLMLDLRQMKNFCERPLIISRGEGIYCYDSNGKRYIEGVSGIYVTNIGHGNRQVIEAIQRQQEKISFVGPLHAVSDTTIRYAERLAQIAPQGLGAIKLLTGGSEATESAFKFARQYHINTGNPGKYKVISNYTGFHGATMGAMSSSGLGWPRKLPFAPFLSGYVQIAPPNCFRPPYPIESATYAKMCGQILDYTIRAEGPETVSAFVVEPISNTGGIIVPPPQYFHQIREACSTHNVLLIFDEIVTGMGRTGDWFAAQTFGVTPDILCCGKGLASGYAPVSAMIARDDIYYKGFWDDQQKNPGFSHGHTFGGNPIGAAAGLAVIDVIERESLIARGREVGEHIRGRLRTEVGRIGVLGEVRGVGALSCVEFVQDMESKASFPEERRFGKRLEERMRDKGLLARCDPHWIAFAPPLIMTIPQADEMVDIFISCLRDELKSAH